MQSFYEMIKASGLLPLPYESRVSTTELCQSIFVKELSFVLPMEKGFHETKPPQAFHKTTPIISCSERVGHGERVFTKCVPLEMKQVYVSFLEKSQAQGFQ